MADEEDKTLAEDVLNTIEQYVQKEKPKYFSRREVIAYLLSQGFDMADFEISWVDKALKIFAKKRAILEVEKIPYYTVSGIANFETMRKEAIQTTLPVET